MKVHLKHGKVTENMHGARRNYRYVWDNVLEARSHASTQETTQARVMTDRELLISLHQKVDCNHEWTKRHLGEILSYMAQMHSSQKKVHQYVHHTYQHLDALMKEVIIPEDLEKLGP